MKLPHVLAYLLAVGLMTASAADRVAFVVGNSTYTTFAPLDNPQQDHDQMVAALEELGFAVTHGSNLSTDVMRSRLKRFVETHASAKEIVFYFSGHGLEIHGENYLAGIDSTLPDTAARQDALKQLLPNEQDVSRQLEIELRRQLPKVMLPLSEAMQTLEKMGKKDAVRVLILDCCRDNPLGAKGFTLSGGKGFAAVDPPSGMLVAFAARKGTVARQTRPGEPSLYTAKLLPHLLTPGLEVEDVFKRTRRDVMAASARAQIPAEYTLLTGSLVFRPPVGAKIARADSPAPRPDPVPEPIPKPRPEPPAVKVTPIEKVFVGGRYESFTPAGKVMVLHQVQRVLGLSSDGKMGAATQRAILAFQSKHSLPATGRVDAATLQRLGLRNFADYKFQ